MAGPVQNSGALFGTAGAPFERGGKLVEGCSGCPTMAFVFAYEVGAGQTFISDVLTWSATAVGGSFPGWRYYGPTTGVCSAGAGGPSLDLREIVFWCENGIWNATIVYLVNGIQDSVSTVGGTLDPFTLFSASGPRSYTAVTPGDGYNLCASGPGHLFLGVVVAA